MRNKATVRKIDKIFNGDLPIIKTKVIVAYDKVQDKYIYDEIPVEILTINLNTQSMRVRYIANIWNKEPEIKCCDIGMPNEKFLKDLIKYIGVENE